MSIQEPGAYSHETIHQTGVDGRAWLKLTVGMAFCFVVIFAWVSGAVNLAQIIVATVILSVGLSARAVLKIDEIDSHGLEEKPGGVETLTGTAVLSLMAALALVSASSLVAPLGGVTNFIMFNAIFAALFAAAIAAESAISAFACFALKPVLTKSAIGAEIAVMLNIQQKFQTRLA